MSGQGKPSLTCNVATLRESTFRDSGIMETFDVAVALAICIIVGQLVFG